METQKRKHVGLIFILGALTALSPFSIDLYLPSFPEIARDFGTTISRISLSLSSYFVGLSAGQLFYGPFLDRFGRKKPLYAGLTLYILASIGCAFANTTESLIALRFLQALGGCAASVSTMSMVRDLFSVKESAKVLSLLILILSVSPLIAPTAGAYIATMLGWHAVFLALAVIAFLLLATVKVYLPETHPPDHSFSLRFKPILNTYKNVIKEPQFYTYVFTGAIAFSGLFVYVSASPIIFLNIFKVSRPMYGTIFAILSTGFIGASQINIFLLRKFQNEQILRCALILKCLAAVTFLVATLNGWYGLYGTIANLYCYMLFLGFVSPNATALALAPFTKNAGSASALLGFIQMGTGAMISMVVGFLSGTEIYPITGIFVATSLVSILVLTIGRKHIAHQVKVKEDLATKLSH